MWVTDRLPDAGLDQTSPFDNLITSYASSSSIDVENHGGSETSSWYSPLPFVGASAISSPTDRISIMLPSHPIAIPSASPTGSAVYYVNPWTQQYESLSPPSPQKEGKQRTWAAQTGWPLDTDDSRYDRARRTRPAKLSGTFRAWETQRAPSCPEPCCVSLSFLS